MLVNLGTADELDSEVTIVQGNGSPGVQLFADVDSTDSVGPPVGTSSTYTIVSPNQISTELVVGASTTNVAETITSIVSHINDLFDAQDPSYTAAAGTGNTIVLTEDDREEVDAVWSITPSHTDTGTSTDGDITASVAVTTEGEDDEYGSADITVTVPTRPGGTADTVVSVTIDDQSTNFIDIAGDAPSDTTADVTANEVAVALEAADYLEHSDSLSGDTLTLLLSAVGRTAEDYAIDGVAATITQSEGTDADTPANLSIEVTNIDDADLDMDLAADQTDDDIRDDIIAHLQDYPQFSLAEAGQTVVITHNQFGSNRALVDVVYTPTMATDRDGVVTAKSTDTIQSVSDVSQMTTDADAERPWDSGVLNEARAFVLSGGGDDIFAMDLSSEFDGKTSLHSWREGTSSWNH